VSLRDVLVIVFICSLFCGDRTLKIHCEFLHLPVAGRLRGSKTLAFLRKANAFSGKANAFSGKANAFSGKANAFSGKA
jgi:hypothetical protein